MDLAELSRRIAVFIEETGAQPNAVIVDENPEGYVKLLGLRVVVDETATKPMRVALVQDL
jgi:hypothetical protein